MKVLIVEDERKLGEILVQGLQENGYLVEWTQDGVTGLEMASRGCHDALILDVMLPGMDGFQILGSLRAAHSTVPVLMLTTRSDVDDRVKGLDLGADDYLPKPFEFKELLARLRAISRRPAAEPQTILKAADLEMNLQTRDVSRGAQAIELTAKEFLLLEYFLRNKGLALTRAMFMDKIWSSEIEYEGGSNLVDVYINLLRKKIDQGFEAKLIQTVRGVGYMLREPA